MGDVAVHRLADQPDTFEIGVTLAPAEHGRGFGTEAVTAVVDALFSVHGAHRVIAGCDARNDPVHALLERIGHAPGVAPRRRRLVQGRVDDARRLRGARERLAQALSAATPVTAVITTATPTHWCTFRRSPSPITPASVPNRANWAARTLARATGPDAAAAK